MNHERVGNCIRPCQRDEGVDAHVVDLPARKGWSPAIPSNVSNREWAGPERQFVRRVDIVVNHGEAALERVRARQNKILITDIAVKHAARPADYPRKVDPKLG